MCDVVLVHALVHVCLRHLHVIYAHLCLSFLMVAWRCGAFECLNVSRVKESKDDEHRSLNEMTRELMLELLAIVSMGVPALGGLGLGYFIVHLPEYYRSRNAYKELPMLFWIGVIGTILDHMNLLSYMFIFEQATDGKGLYIYDGIGPISPNCDQLACMVFVLTLRSIHAKDKVRNEKNRQRIELGYIRKADHKHSDKVNCVRWVWWCLIPLPLAILRFLVSLILVCVAIDLHGHDPTSWTFLSSFLSARVLSGIGLFIVLKDMFQQVFKQLDHIEKNLDVMNDVAKTLPHPFADEAETEGLEYTWHFLGPEETEDIEEYAYTSGVALRGMQSMEPRQDRRGRRDTVCIDMPKMGETVTHMPSLIEWKEASCQDWLKRWHYIRTTFLDEQFSLDAILGMCVLTMLFCALQLGASWLCFDPHQSNFTYQGLHSAMAIAFTVAFGAIFMYLSRVCIKVNELFQKILKQLDELSSRTWREKGYEHFQIMQDFKATIEAGGSPHTLLGYTLTWRLVFSILAPLLAPTLAHIKPLFEGAQHNVHDMVWNSTELIRASRDAEYWIKELANMSHLQELVST